MDGQMKQAQRPGPARGAQGRAGTGAGGSAGGDAAALGPIAQRANAGPHAASLAGLRSVVAQRECADCEHVRRAMGGAQPVQRHAAGVEPADGPLQLKKRFRGVTMSLAEFQQLPPGRLSALLEAERERTREQRHFGIPFRKAEDANLANWSQGHPELAGSHHKFPKRTLGWMTSRMTKEQHEQLNARLFLPRDAGPAALARLRSNLIPWGPDHVASDRRLDDPEHTGESLDMVKTESGALTPRSRSYSNLAFTYDDIRRRLDRTREATMTDREAGRIAEHLREAEEWHHAIEEDSGKPADYGEDFWQESPQARKERKWVKGRVPDEKYEGVERDPEAYAAERMKEEEERRLETTRRLETKKLGYTPARSLSGMEQLMRGDHWKH